MRGKGSCGSCYCSKLECSTHGLFRCASQCGPHLILCLAPLPPLKEEEEEKIKRSGKRLVGKKRKKMLRWTSLFCETHNNMFLFPVDRSMYDLCHQRQLISIHHQQQRKRQKKSSMAWGGGASPIPINTYHGKCVFLQNCRRLQPYFEK